MVKDLAEPDAAADVFRHAKDNLGCIDALINAPPSFWPRNF
jgi:hypothetical protein